MLLAVGGALAGSPAWALPEFLARFARDPFSRPELRAQCSTCHISPQGGGPRNPFGTAFERLDHVVTPELRQAWPSHFLPTVSPAPVASAQGEVRATFLANQQDALVEVGGERYRLNVREARFERITPEQAASLVAAPPQPAVAQEPKLPLRDQPTFDHTLVNLPTTLPVARGSLSLRFTHRFTQPVIQIGEGCAGCAGVSDLLGFDSFSYSSLGGTYGITDRLAASLYRSPLDRNYEFGGLFQLLRQQGREPLSAALRVSFESRLLFNPDASGNERFQTTNFSLPVSRAVSNIAEVFVVPTFSYRANPLPPEGPGIAEIEKRHNLTVVGLGASVRLRPRTAFVMEWMPRVAGYRAAGTRNSYSFGILRSTNRHVFELVLTNSVGTTTSGAPSFGSSDFTLGFNLYRRLR
jgi:hypothetical protein